MKKIIAIALAASAAFAEASIPMGICITNITATATGFEVDWVTDQPPPYRAAVHIPAEVGIIRTRPVEYVDTYLCHAVITGRFYDVAVFLQVYKPNQRLCPPSLTRKMRPTEWDNYVTAVRRRPVRTIVGTPRWFDSPGNLDIAGITPQHMSLGPGAFWSTFIMTNATDLTFTVNLHNRQTTGDTAYSTNRVSQSFSLTGRNPSVGTGFRILVDADRDDGQMEVIAMPAYSAMPDMSQAVLVKRGWKSLSTNGEGWKFATDWEGSPVMVRCTNAVPYRIYGEGL